MSETQISRQGNRIIFFGDFLARDIDWALATLHQTVNNAGYQDVIFDFGACTAAFAEPMLAFCAQVMKTRDARIDTDYYAPKDEKLKRLFQNANWAHFLAPRYNDPSSFQGYTQIPATQFRTAASQQEVVNQVMGAILGVSGLERPELAALEWSINEIMDNVLTHSNSTVGGLVQVYTTQKNKKKVHYVVADAGEGIPGTLRPSRPEISSDAAALHEAIREGVTRDEKIGQGNGLFGSYQICSHSKGAFHIESGCGRLRFTERDGLHVKTQKVPYSGTLVAAQINLSVPGLLENALKFGGKVHTPTDFVETHYEIGSENEVIVVMKNEAPSFGSRIAGTPVRNKLLNLAKMCPGRICVDFTDVHLVSSSFADEVIGKLFAELGPLAFMQKFELRKTAPTVKQLVDKAISQRLAGNA